MKRFLVTGIGRSGTKYTADLLTAAGLPCGWEKAFFAHKADTMWPMPPQGEASWFAMPMIGSLPAGTVVLHQTREPLAWLNSWLQLSPKWNQSVISFVEDHSGFYIWERAEHPASDLQLFVNWQTQVEESVRARKLPYLRYKLEDMGQPIMQQIFKLVGVPFNNTKAVAALRATPQDTNGKKADPKYESLTWDDLPKGPALEAFKEMSRRYGYEVPK